VDVVGLLGTFLTIYIICVFLWVLLSWLPMVLPELAANPTIGSIRRFLDSVVEPYVRLFRFIPPVRMGDMLLDLSSLAAILVLTIGGPAILNLFR
jgi:uncharacterized protein YggT (Ycf19 family)